MDLVEEQGGAAAGEDAGEEASTSPLLHSPEERVKELAERLDMIYAMYVTDAPRHAYRYGRFVLDLFAEQAGENGESVPPAELNPALLRRSYASKAAGLNRLVQELRVLGAFADGPAGICARVGLDSAQLRSRVWHLRLFLGQLFSMAVAMLGCAVRRSEPSAPLQLDDDSAKYPFLNQGEGSVARMPPNAMLIYFFLGQAYLHGLRREGSMVYEQRFVGSQPSHAWTPLYSIHDFIHTMATKETHTDVWHMLHGDGSRVVTVERYLESCTDAEFPTIRRQRRYQSFRNGVYDVHRDRFLPYRTGGLDEDVVACNLHDLEVQPEWFRPEALADPCLIPTPQLDRIFAEQGFHIGGDVYQWILAWVLGRPQYDMGTVEKHHRNGVFLLGHAGSGKSTLAKVLQRFYADKDTGQLNSECEPKFALAALSGKYVWFCTEVKKNFQLDMGMLLQMLEGRTRISVQEKFKTARDEEWNIPGLMAGNEIPSKWIDGGAGNSLVRRMMIVEFPNKPHTLDPNLEGNILRELAAIMVKANRLYRMLADRIGDRGDIDAALPNYFRDTLARFQAKTQPFVYMLNNHPDLHREPEAHITLLDLKGMYTQWCRLNNSRGGSIDDDELIRQLRSQGLRVEKGGGAAGAAAGAGLRGPGTAGQQGWIVYGLSAGFRSATDDDHTASAMSSFG
jgi:energy-coupling factor transporter ATP-binding protein EcfA2